MKKTIIIILLFTLLFSACTFLFLDFDGSEEMGHNYWRINNYQGDFGESVDIDDVYAVVSCPKDSLGEVCIFKTENNDWQEIKTIKASYGELSGNVDVAINADLVVIGSPSKNEIYTYQLTDEEWIAIDTLTKPESSAYSEFGICVDVLDGVLLVASETGPALYYRFNDGEWEPVLTLSMGERQDEDLYFSFHKPKVRISENFIVTAKGSDVIVYQRTGDNCTFLKQFEASNSDMYSYYGCAIAVDDSCVAVGDYYYREGNGQVYSYRYEDTTWVEETILGTHGNFGYSLDLKDDFMVVGSTALEIWSGGAAAVFEYSMDEDSAMVWDEKRDFYETRHCGNDVAMSDEYVILSGSSCAYIYKYR